MTEPVAAYKGPVMWADGSNLILTVNAPEGLLYQQTFPMAVFAAVIAGDGEIIRFTYDWTDPEDGQVTRGAARLVLQQLPDPRDQKTEEQPAAWKCIDCGYEDSERSLICPNCATDGELMAEEQSTEHPASPAGATVDQLPDADADPEIERKRMRIVPIGPPFPGFPSEAELADRIFGPGTAESLGTAARYIERPSGPPVRVDGPGCTPATVREFRPCDDCTTPFTCEEGGEDRCP